MAENVTVKRKPHPLDYWLGKPVLVQLGHNHFFAAPRGSMDVPTVDEEGKDSTAKFHIPDVAILPDGKQPMVAPCLPCLLHRDPVCDERLVAEMLSDKQPYIVQVSVHPKDITSISVILPKETPSIIAP